MDLLGRGLLAKLSKVYDDMFMMILGEEATMLSVDNGVLQSMTIIDQNVSFWEWQILILEVV
jgi:hypothetical protein